MADHFFVALVVLRVDPGLAVSLLREQMHHALHVARGEIVDKGPRWHVPVFIAQAWRTLTEPRLIHMIDEPANIFRREIGVQSPGGVDVAKGRDQVRYVRKHHALVGIGLRKFN